MSGVHPPFSVSRTSVKVFFASSVHVHLRIRPSVPLVFSTQSRSLFEIILHAPEPLVGDVTVNDARGVGSVTVSVALLDTPR